MKPHITKDPDGLWRCWTEGFSGIAATPALAYSIWLEMQ